MIWLAALLVSAGLVEVIRGEPTHGVLSAGLVLLLVVGVKR